MLLIDRLKDDLKTALKSGQKERVGVLRFLLSESHNREKDKQARLLASERSDGGQAKGEKPVLTDEEAVAVFQKESKKRREAVELFRKGGREDLVKKETAELAVIQEYLPQVLAPEDIKKVLEKLAARGNKDFNSLMKEAMKELRGKADGRLVSELIKEILQ